MEQSLLAAVKSEIVSVALLFVLLVASCNNGPQPLVIGKDECHYCKMPIADVKFGGEIITEKGKIYKFDDTGCLIDFMNGGLGENEKVKDAYSVDYAGNQALLHIRAAVFFLSENLRTPMNSGIAAFASHDEAEAFHATLPGEMLTWDQLLEKRK